MLLKCFIACTSCPPNTTYQKYFPTTHLENNLSLPCCAQDVLLQNTLKKYLVLVNKVIKNSIFKTKIKTRLPIKFSSTCNFRKKRVCGKNVSQSKYWNALYQETHVIYINSNTIKKKKKKIWGQAHLLLPLYSPNVEYYITYWLNSKYIPNILRKFYS